MRALIYPMALAGTVTVAWALGLLVAREFIPSYRVNHEPLLVALLLLMIAGPCALGTVITASFARAKLTRWEWRGSLVLVAVVALAGVLLVLAQ
jgi:hypothetical protein